jgi:hypothetical protein
MAYAKQTWTDYSGTGTPAATAVANASRLNTMETGIDVAHSLIEGVTTNAQLATAVGTATTYGQIPFVKLGVGLTISSQHTIDRAVWVEGQGNRGGVTVPTFTGWPFSCEGLTRGGEWQGADLAFDPADDMGGVEFHNMHLNGLDRANVRNGIRVPRADDLRMYNCTFGFLNGTAVQLGGNPDDTGSQIVRECQMSDVTIMKCGGDGDDGAPGMVVQNNNTGSSDGTNQMIFHNLRYVLNHGPLLIRAHSTTELARRITFSNTQIHGLHNGLENDTDLVIIEGNVTTTIFDHAIVNASSAGNAVWHIKPSLISGNSPADVRLTNISATTCPGDVVKISGVDDIVITGRFNLGAISGAAVRFLPGSGVDFFEIRAWGTGSPTGKFIVPSADQSKGDVYWNGNLITPATS